MEVLFIIVMIALLVVPPWVFLRKRARIYWGTFFSIIGGLLGAFEIIGKVEDGRTISQMFWNWASLNPTTGWIVLFLMWSGFTMVIVHLAWKLLFDKDYSKPGKHGK